MRYLGPYLRKSDNRKYMVVFNDDGTRSTTSYARYLMSQALGRLLDPVLETVDHINNDRTDDRIENLQLLTQSENIKKFYKSPGGPKAEYSDLECINCHVIFKRKAWRERMYRKQGRIGPFCNQSCEMIYISNERKKNA